MRVGRWMWWRRRRRELDAGAAAREWERLAALPDARVASGPGLVTAAFDITRAHTGLDLLDSASPFRIEVGAAPRRIKATPRIGIAYAPEPWQSQPWRFVDEDSRAVSGARPRRSAS
jgi:3-methyladenine DNA glycosylase Mpg